VDGQVLFSNKHEKCPKTHQTSACILAEPLLVMHIHKHYLS